MEIMDLMSSALGLDRSAEELQSLHMVARGIVVYVISLLIVKLAKKRFMGQPSALVRDGRIDWDQMRKHDITERDLRSAMRVLANTEDMSAIKTMYLEPNGKLSIVKAS